MSNQISLEELNNLDPKERALALKILREMTQKGDTSLYTELITSDYDEVPVDIETFMKAPKYLGKGLVDSFGKFTVFPYWVDFLKKLFPDPLKPAAYRTVALTGSIGIGKSFIAVVAGLYELYRMICLKDPYQHYGMQPIDKISFAFMNITLDASTGVAWDKCQQLLQSSEWFMSKGTVKGKSNIVWVPPKGIELIVGSTSDHIIGRAVYWCVAGDTVVVTSDGPHKIEDLVNRQSIQVCSLDALTCNVKISKPCFAMATVKTKEEYIVTLSNDVTISCTANHKFMLNSGYYVEARYLNEGSRLASQNIRGIKVKSVEKRILEESKQFYDIMNAYPYNNFLIKVGNAYVCAHNCFFDEISFQRNMDVNIQKAKAKTLVNTADVRMQSRFMKGTKNPTLLMLASSKRTEQSYLEDWIANKKKKDSKTTYIVDEPQWVIRTDKDSPYKFKVAVGNKFLSNEVVPLGATEEQLEQYRLRGYTLMDVPMGYYEKFVDDIDVALTDIAGISTSSYNRYFSGPRIAAIISNEYQNLFTKEIIEIGNAEEDSAQYYDFIDMTRLMPEYKSKPLYIHMDLSKSGDKTGIAGIWVMGKSPPKPNQPESKDLVFKLAFAVAVKAPKGCEVSFEKNRLFIYWLKENGFNIKAITTDTFQSVDTGQALTQKGFNYSVLSVDRVDTASRVCLPYQYLRSTIYEKRFTMFNMSLLLDELVGLERDNNSGKIDHSVAGINSKDVADAVCGSIYRASQDAEQYAYDYGESIDTMLDVSSPDIQESVNQVIVDFESELARAFTPKVVNPERSNDKTKPKVEQKPKPATNNAVHLDWGSGGSSDDDIIII